MEVRQWYMIHSDHVDQLAPDVSGLMYSCVTARSVYTLSVPLNSRGFPVGARVGPWWRHIVSRPTPIEADIDIHVII